MPWSWWFGMCFPDNNMGQPPLMDEEEHRQVPASRAEILLQKTEQDEE